MSARMLLFRIVFGTACLVLFVWLIGSEGRTWATKNPWPWGAVAFCVAFTCITIGEWIALGAQK